MSDTGGSEISREKFIELVIEHVREKFPLAKIARADQAFSVKVNGHVASMENLYRMTVLRPADINRHVDRWMVQLLRASEGSPDLTATFDELKERIFPMVISQTTTDLAKGTMVAQ